MHFEFGKQEGADNKPLITLAAINLGLSECYILFPSDICRTQRSSSLFFCKKNTTELPNFTTDVTVTEIKLYEVQPGTWK
jgi:hypothetical protein